MSFRSRQLLVGMRTPQPLKPSGDGPTDIAVRRRFSIANASGATVYLGDAAVTTDSGLPLADGTSKDFYGDPTHLYAETGGVKTLAVSAEADDIIDCVGHGFTAGKGVFFRTLTGGAGLHIETLYYVIAANLAADTFQVSETVGGAAFDFTTDITAGTVCLARDLRLLEWFD